MVDPSGHVLDTSGDSSLVCFLEGHLLSKAEIRSVGARKKLALEP